jgi:S1-C subfamily serine protease
MTNPHDEVPMWGPVATVAPRPETESSGAAFPPPPPASGPRSAGRRGQVSRAAVTGALAGGLVAAVVAGGVGFAAGRIGSHDNGTARQEVGQAAPAALSGQAIDFHTLLRRVTPSVVSIRLGQTNGNQVVDYAAGSGVIISSDGLVLTNAHVVAGADVINVHLSDGRTIRADLVGTAPSHDIALVRLRATNGLTPARLGSSSAMQVGDQVVAIGNALALGDAPTVTSGIVSAKNRTLNDGETTLTNLLQTDAAINHGNSGGPLLNAAGEVVGINTAGIPNAENLGFAIEIDAIKPLIQKLKTGRDHEVQVQAFLGISTQQGAAGVVITSVQPESAASDAGLKAGDVIRKLNGTRVTGPDTVRAVIQASRPGARLTLQIERAGQLKSISAVLGSRPTAPTG